MPKPSETSDDDALSGVLGLGSHSARKSHYPELLARLAELESERNRCRWLNEVLEQRVAERTAALEQQSHQLQKARDEAEAANRSKSKHLAAASHDLLQPLNAARLLIASLLERHLPTVEAHLVQRAHQALESAEDLLSDLLEISKLDQCTVKADMQDWPLAELFAALASEFAPIAAEAGLRLRVRPCHCWVRTDARLLLRILRNLLSNACRYTEHGGVLLACRKRQGTLQLQVWDSGRGIPAQQLEAIFLEFNQLGSSHDGRKGVGLGLAIVERMARVLDTSVKVRSVPARGSVFFFDLPPGKARPIHATAAEAPPLSIDPLPGQRLLVIDNEPQILHSMGVLLGGWGCEVISAENGQQALSRLNGAPPALILADYHLANGQTGCTLIRELRAQFAQDIPAVIISADHSDTCRHRLASLNLPLLNKPIKPGKLRALLSQLLSQQHAAAAAAAGC